MRLQFSQRTAAWALLSLCAIVTTLALGQTQPKSDTPKATQEPETTLEQSVTTEEADQLNNSETTTAPDAKASEAEETAAKIDSLSDEERFEKVTWPLIVLGIGIAIVLGLIIGFKINAFLALIAAAMVVSLCAPGEINDKIARVASAFGSSAGGIGIVIGLAAVIGSCLLESGAADRIVRQFVKLLGEKRSPVALMGSGFVLAVPVFFDTVFYLLVPLARSLYRRTNRNYLLYILAIAAGGAITHSLVPPTPGPLLMASNLNIELGFMIMIGALVALPAAIGGLIFSIIADKLMPIPMRQTSDSEETEPIPDDQLPSLTLSLLPVILPVILIASNTVLTTQADREHAALIQLDDVKDWNALRSQIASAADAEGESPGKRLYARLSEESQSIVRQEADLSDEQKTELVDSINTTLSDKQLFDKESTFGIRLNSTAESLLAKDKLRMKKVVAERMNRSVLESTLTTEVLAAHEWNTTLRQAANFSSLLGNANLALLISTIIAILLVVKQRGLSRTETARIVEQSLMSGGVIILITAGGGAFGAMLKAAKIGDSIELIFDDILNQGGSSIVLLSLAFALAAVLKIAQGSSTVAMIVGSSMMAAIVNPDSLGFNPVYLATAIGSGSLMGSWMNDSGFWIFAKMGGLTETEALKSWTIMLGVLGAIGFGMSILLSQILPLTS